MSDGQKDGENRANPRVLDERYELIELIGAGGMAEVWRARDNRLNRDVAVKVLLAADMGDPSRRKRIEREARALATLHHPNIVAVYDYGEATRDPEIPGDVEPYIVMELVDGPDLHRYVNERGPLPADEAARILGGILAGTEVAHAAGIVHGDLKSSNIIMGSRGPKVGDFGVARVLDQETGTTTMAATPSFAAPEVLRGERPTAASDVYSASCIGFELLAGRPPFEGANAWEVAHKHLELPPPRLRTLRSDVPADLEAAIDRGLAKNPRRRFGSPAAFAAAIGAAAGATTPVDQPESRSVQAERPETEVIGAGRPSAARLAVFGPLAGVVERIRRRRADRLSPRPDKPGHDPRRRWLVIASIALVLLFLALILTKRGGGDIQVPDVKGMTAPQAAAALGEEGLGVSEVSYRPVTNGEPNRVLDTIPSAGASARRGSKIHIIASALAATPTPTPVVQQQPSGDDDEEEGKGQRNVDGRGRNKGNGD